jgi:tRNA(adenine34) deaminase
MDDISYMNEALKEAMKAFDANEVPVGAVIVFEGEIIARAHNRVEGKGLATAHAELLCIEQASQKLGNFRLLKCILYTTLEPCLMCAGACVLSRVAKIIYAAKDIRHGAFVSQFQLFDKPHPIHTPEVVQGPCEGEASALMKKFFRQKRETK